MTVHTRLEPDRSADLELAARVAARDSQAVRLVTQRNNQRLFRAAWSILGDRDEAEDAVQTAYLRAFAAIESFHGQAALSSWLTRIAINVALGRLRAIRRKRAWLENESTLFLDDYRERVHGASSRRLPDECLAQAQLGRLLEAAIAKLPARFRTVFVLREMEDLSVAEVAEILGIPDATVRTRHLRARTSLQRLLAPDIGGAAGGMLPFAGIDCERATGRIIAAYCRSTRAKGPASVENRASSGPWSGERRQGAWRQAGMLDDDDYRTLAAVRAAIRGFGHFTEKVARSAGLTPQQHQALVALRAAESGELSMGQLAEALLLRPHSVSGLADRLQAMGLVERIRRQDDRRGVVLRLTAKARDIMTSLSRTHRDELRRIRPLLISLLSQLD